MIYTTCVFACWQCFLPGLLYLVGANDEESLSKKWNQADKALYDSKAYGRMDDTDRQFWIPVADSLVYAW